MKGGKMKQSQTERIIGYLKTGRGLTAFQAFKRGWGMRCSGRIYDARAMGYDIDKQMIKVNDSWVAEYFMSK